MNPQPVRLLAVLLLATQAYACIAFDAKVSRPREFTGRWARLRDTTWTDTVELTPDGRVLGWRGTADRDSVSWSMIHTHVGDALCIGTRQHPSCQDFRLEGDTLVLGIMPKQSYWRRAH